MIENDWNDDERRQQERYSLSSHLNAYSQSNNLLVGYVVDISLGGMMLLSEEPLPTGKSFYFRLDVRLGDNHQDQMLLEAISVWGKPDANPGLHNTGFRFANLSTATLLSLHNLIDRLSADL